MFFFIWNIQWIFGIYAVQICYTDQHIKHALLFICSLVYPPNIIIVVLICIYIGLNRYIYRDIQGVPEKCPFFSQSDWRRDFLFVAPCIYIYIWLVGGVLENFKCFLASEMSPLSRFNRVKFSTSRVPLELVLNKPTVFSSSSGWVCRSYCSYAPSPSWRYCFCMHWVPRCSSKRQNSDNKSDQVRLPNAEIRERPSLSTRAAPPRKGNKCIFPLNFIGKDARIASLGVKVEYTKCTLIDVYQPRCATEFNTPVNLIGGWGLCLKYKEPIMSCLNS